MSRLYLLIGNGSSIGIVTKINEYRAQTGEPPLNINLSNLFFYGAAFNFPKTNTPFLTKEHCPNLWALGARPGMNDADARRIISQIITCGNVYVLAKYQEEVLSLNNFDGYGKNRPMYIEQYDEEIINKLYFAAYCEFSSYIRYLIIYYNSQITDNDLLNIDVPLITYLKKNYNNFKSIIFNSYNYDVLMERLLYLNNLPFTLGEFSCKSRKITFYKPHGSISFFYKKQFSEDEPYRIPYNELSFQQRIKTCDFHISYDFFEDYPIHNGMVPPFGEAERYEMAYYQKIRNAIIKANSKSKNGDIYYIIGFSYGNVDRFELDRVNTSFNKLVAVTYVDPFPNPDFDAVLSSLFINYNQTSDFEG